MTIISVFLSLLFITGCATGSDKKNGTNLKKAAEFNVQLGSGYLSQGRLNLAKDKLTKALDQDSDNALAHSTMALLLEKVGQLEDIEEHYEEAMDLAPDNSDINNNYGTFLCNQSRFVDAQKQFKKAINDPYYKTPIVALVNAGKCEMKNKDYKSAEKYLRKALRLNSRSVSALYFMGELGILSKKYLMARAYMQRYHSVARQSAKSLWIQIQAEKALGDKVVMKKLIERMNKKFPDSDEASIAIGLIR
ncbi:MAG: type IV pilus biogenesis/stability protein PilW [Gammaproteobacteria bacterium]|nr:type IV pilus biogenesis/stability protein PilW [Gammaproteobacteria bacterium]